MKNITVKTLSKCLPLFFILFLFLGYKSEVTNEIPEIDLTGLPSNVINKIVIDNQGIKWIATDQGLVSFDGTHWKTYANSTWINHPILDVSFDEMSNKQAIWAATFEGSIKGTIVGYSLTASESYRKTANQLLCDTIWSVASDMNNAKFFGTPKGISIFKNSIWTSYQGDWGRTTDNFLITNPITAIATAKNGWIYAATRGGGVSRFKFIANALTGTDAVTGATKYFQPWAGGLRSDNVNTVVVVNDTCQWYGTDKGASFHSSHQTKSDWTPYSNASTSNGLVSDTVYAIAQDALGDTWFGTHRGVSMMKNNVWTNYTTKDGLIGSKVNTLAIDIDGSVWFGTDLGLSHLNKGIWTSYTTGISGIEATKYASVKIWMNAAKQLNCNLDESWTAPFIQITDISGRLIVEKKVSNKFIVNLSNFNHGCYMVIIKENKKVITRKIVL